MSDRKHRHGTRARSGREASPCGLDERLRPVFGVASAPQAFAIVAAIAQAARGVADLLADGALLASEQPADESLANPNGRHAGSPPEGDDIARAEAIFVAALVAAPATVIALPDGRFAHPETQAFGHAVTLSPLDRAAPAAASGAATVFSILPERPHGDAAGRGGWPPPEATFLQPGRGLLAAGYILYGARTTLVIAVAGRLHQFRLDRHTGGFVVLGEECAIPATSSRLACDISRERQWPTPARTYLEDCLAGPAGPHGREHALRWSGSSVAELHEILHAGGTLFLPTWSPPALASGGLALLHQAAPLALVAEAAGGRASDGLGPLLGRTPRTLLEHVPVALGSREEVDRIERYQRDPFHARRSSPLFAARGLFHS